MMSVALALSLIHIYNVADAYIEAFLATLDSVNPGLHALLTEPLPDTVAIDRP